MRTQVNLLLQPASRSNQSQLGSLLAWNIAIQVVDDSFIKSVFLGPLEHLLNCKSGCCRAERIDWLIQEEVYLLTKAPPSVLQHSSIFCTEIFVGQQSAATGLQQLQACSCLQQLLVLAGLGARAKTAEIADSDSRTRSNVKRVESKIYSKRLSPLESRLSIQLIHQPVRAFHCLSGQFRPATLPLVSARVSAESGLGLVDIFRG